MAYVPVPKDLNAVKTKVMFNLTKRQILCFGGGALIGVPLFFLLKGHIGSSAAALCMMLVMLPFFLLAMYEKNGQPPEKLIRNIVQVCFLRPKQRPYRTNNFYDLLEEHHVAYTAPVVEQMSPILQFMITYILPTILLLGAFLRNVI